MTTTTAADHDQSNYSNKLSLDPPPHVAAENPDSILDDDDDRLSALPEEILHQILSYLCMTEVIKTSLLSTRWRNLWKSHPFLRLRSSNFIANCGVNIMDFIEHVLLLRDHHSSKLVLFRLYSTLNFQVDRFLESIVTAVNQGVQVIDTKQKNLAYDNDDDDDDDDEDDNDDDDEDDEDEDEDEDDDGEDDDDDDDEDDDDDDDGITTLNPCIFDSGVVSVFKFAVTDSKFRIQIPLSMCSSTHLRLVRLNGIRLPKGNSNKELHLICPILEELTIINCCHKHLSVLSISTPKLKTLCIYNYHINNSSRHFQDLHGECILEISTPKLKSFKYFGYSYSDYTFKDNLPFLTHATVDPVLLVKENDIVELETKILRWIKILKAISNAKWLWIDLVEIYSWVVPNTLRKEVLLLLNPFTRLRYLNLRSIPSLSSVHGTAYLLLNTCNVLETFVWDVYKEGPVKEDDEGKEHEDVMLWEGSFSHLKLVKTKNLRGHKNEVLFLRFLLKSAVVLEKMIITTANPINKEIADQENQEQLKQRKFIEDLEALRNCCPSTKLTTFKIN